VFIVVSDRFRLYPIVSDCFRSSPHRSDQSSLKKGTTIAFGLVSRSDRSQVFLSPIDGCLRVWAAYFFLARSITYKKKASASCTFPIHSIVTTESRPCAISPAQIRSISHKNQKKESSAPSPQDGDCLGTGDAIDAQARSTSAPWRPLERSRSLCSLGCRACLASGARPAY
jgi:hypothetical protein